MSLSIDWDAIKAAVHVHQILFEYEWVTLATLKELIKETPEYVQRYLRQRYKGDKLSKFLKLHPSLFHMENGRVSQYEIHKAREEAVSYFEEKLKDYETRPLISNFKGCIGQANKKVKEFIRVFYPGDKFKQFLSSRPDVFVVYTDGTVWLIEKDSVDYFEEKLEGYKAPVHYMNFRGHIGQAPPHVLQYVNDKYPGKDFLEFLQEHPDVFELDDQGYLWLPASFPPC